MGRALVVPIQFDWIWPDEVVFMNDWSSCPSFQPYKNMTFLTQKTHTLIWTYIRSSYDVHEQDFTSNIWWESQTFHHDKNLSGLYSGGFSKSFGSELTIFAGLFNPFVPNAPFLYPLKTSENFYGFLMFSGCRERVHWERMG